MRRGRRARRDWQSRRWREALLSVLERWGRHQISRIVAAVLLSWILGATAIYMTERHTNSNFSTWGESLWSVWVLLFSGLDSPPRPRSADW